MSDSSYTVTGGSQPQPSNVKRLNVIPVQPTVTAQPYETQPKPPQQKQVTLGQSDLDNVSAEMLFDPQEIEFMNRLNVDSEIKKKSIPVFDSTETSIEVSQPKKIDTEEIKIYVAKCVSRQVMVNTLASMEKDFYDKVSICSDAMTESSSFYLEEFIHKRLGLIIQYSKSFSLNVNDKLTNEERELYQGLCELINRYKQTIDKKAGLNK